MAGIYISRTLPVNLAVERKLQFVNKVCKETNPVGETNQVEKICCCLLLTRTHLKENRKVSLS